jgi:hypothetical protein
MVKLETIESNGIKSRARRQHGSVLIYGARRLRRFNVVMQKDAEARAPKAN